MAFAPRLTVTQPDVDAAVFASEERLARTLTAAMTDATNLLKADLRQMTRDAGLGNRVANTWRGQAFPRSGASLEPAAYVKTRAPKIIDAFAEARTIRPRASRAAESFSGRVKLVIPGRDIRRVGLGARPSPEAVERRMNQDFILKPGRNGHWLAFVDLAYGRWRRMQGAAYGRGGKRRYGQERKRPRPQLIHVFTFVTEIRTRKRYDLGRTGQTAGAQIPSLIARHWRG